jgi:hypothetical protein
MNDLVKELRKVHDWRAKLAAERIEMLEVALRKIAANACCDNCREAALVVRTALEKKND